MTLQEKEELLKSTPVYNQYLKEQNFTRRYLVVFGISISLFLAAITLGPLWYFSTQVEDTHSIPGDARTFDPISAFSSIQGLAGSKAQLTSMQANFVRSDGTMNLKANYAPSPEVSYEFVESTPQDPRNQQPLGVVASPETELPYRQVSIHVSRPWVTSHVQKRGGTFSMDYSYINLGMKRTMGSVKTDAHEPIATTPHCTFADLWSKAITQGAQKEAVASIHYNTNGYIFDIKGTQTHLTFTPDCQLVKT